MNNIKILISDDESHARVKIINFLNNLGYYDNIEESSDGIETIEMINKFKPDLIFLDVQMPKANGFDVIESVPSDDLPHVIFVTAYDEYAIEAFKVEAVDYLLKPFDEERFKVAFERGINRINSSQDLRELIGELNFKRNRFLDRIIVEKNKKYKFIQTNEIIYIEAQDKYIRINTTSESFLLRHTLSGFEKRLNPTQFKRTHRSFIVNLSQIKEIQPWANGDFVIILKNNIKVKLARRFKKAIFDDL